MSLGRVSVGGGGGSSIKFASGTVTSLPYSESFYRVTGSAFAAYRIEVTGLTFTPRVILVASTNGKSIVTEYSADLVYATGVYDGNILAGTYPFALLSPAVVSNTGFILPTTKYSTVYNWVAYG